jgi:predicted dehydrogenase
MGKHVTVAVVGAGMAGQAHAFGYRNATMHPDLAGFDVRLSVIVDFNSELARSVANRYGFATATADLDAVLGDDGIDGVSLALPNFAYAEVIPALIAAGKHVLAEKPLGRSAAEAHRFATAADAASLVHSVGFSWRRLAAVETIAQIVASGGIGRLWHATAWYLTDYASTPTTPLSWRYDQEQAGGGAIVDIGAHVLAVLEHVAGPIRRVLAADARILIPQRPVPSGPVVGHGAVQGTGEMGPVSTDDVTTAIIELASGGSAQVTVSRIATGVPNSLGFQLIGSEGSVGFDSARPDEFLLYQRSVAAPESNGPRLVTVGPEQPSFAYTIPMPARGVGSGYGAAFVAQAQDFLLAILGRGEVANDFWTGYQTMLVCDAAQQSAAEGRSIDIAALDANYRRTSLSEGDRPREGFATHARHPDVAAP